jgi:ribosomal 50S subunit-recycling heat shock protein
MDNFVPPQPPKSFRVTIELESFEKRLDSILLAALKEQDAQPLLKQITRAKFKELFSSGKILIKGQRAKPTSSLAAGTTYVDILGF